LQAPIELEQRADPSGKPEQHARVNIVRAGFSKNLCKVKTGLCTQSAQVENILIKEV
jgi:hypothetical protein